MNDEVNKNLSVWSQAYKTDPSATKSYKGAGGFSGTAIASLYPVQRATEIFGPMGSGWGFEITEDTFIQGGPMINREGVPLNCNEQTHSMKISMWAKHGEKELKSIGIGLTPHITQNKYGVVTDHEAQKKSLTDAIKGALKLWGFSADVFMGDHDDHEYVKSLQNEVAMDKAEDKAEEKLRQDNEYETWKATNLKLLEDAVSGSMLEGLYKTAVLKAKRREDDEYIAKMVATCKTRKEQLTKDKPEDEAA